MSARSNPGRKAPTCSISVIPTWTGSSWPWAWAWRRHAPTTMEGFADAFLAEALKEPRPQAHRGGDLTGQPALLAARMIALIGVGLKPLHGLLTCGQLEITASASMSARSPTWQPR